MPPDFPTWLFYAVAGTAVVFYLPRLWKHLTRMVVWVLRTLGRAIADALVDALAEQLQPSWTIDFRKELDEALGPIREELSANGGESVKDKVNSTANEVAMMRRDIEPILHEYRRYNPPEGTPI